jgi:hypothetical protein
MNFDSRNSTMNHKTSREGSLHRKHFATDQALIGPPVCPTFGGFVVPEYRTILEHSIVKMFLFCALLKKTYC